MQRKRLPSAMYWRALKEARPWYPQLLLIIVLGLLTTPIALLAPVPVKIIIDHVVGNEPVPGFVRQWVPAALTATRETILYASIGFGIVVALLTVVHGMAEWLYRETIADQMVRVFRAKVMGNALTQAGSRSDDKGVVDGVFRISQDAPALQSMTIWGVIPLITYTGSVVWVVWATAFISPQVALVALATALPLIVLIILKQRPLCNRWHIVRERESRLMQIAYEVLGGRRVVLTACQEGAEVKRLIDQGRAAFMARLGVMLIDAGFRVAVTLATGIGTAFILYLGVRDVQAGVITKGDLVLLAAYMVALYKPLEQIAQHIVQQQSAFACGERAFALLEAPPSVPEAPDPRPLSLARGEVEFRDVGLAYPDGPALLRGVSFRIRPGTCVGIVGPTGSGKSTLVNLLVRLMDPTAGTILLDGADLREYALRDLRRQFAVVEQDPSLFSTTIAQNIAYGRPGAPMHEIEAAARRAQAHGFIAALPHGYDSLVGERALMLSGGERQRICLARAFLKQAPMLILDEPTSALDRDTETAVTAAIEELMRGRTTFIIAHRLSTLRRADVILRIEDGHVAVEGGIEAAAIGAALEGAGGKVVSVATWAAAHGRGARVRPVT